MNEVVIEDKQIKGQKYVSEDAYSNLENLIIKAEKIYIKDYPNEIYDYIIYLLYLGNFGSQSDIGAKFAGFNYIGFDNEIKTKN